MIKNVLNRFQAVSLQRNEFKDRGFRLILFISILVFSLTTSAIASDSEKKEKFVDGTLSLTDVQFKNLTNIQKKFFKVINEEKPGNSFRPEGTFTDSPVRGLFYISTSGIGLTDKDGKFRYKKEKDMILFTVGTIILGDMTAAKTVITPTELVTDAIDYTAPMVINISRFLQTLDDNQNPDDGIFIADDVIISAVGEELDFTLPESEFEQAAQMIINRLFENNPRTLVSADTAVAHLRESILSLVSTTRDDKGVFLFLICISLAWYQSLTHLSQEHSLCLIKRITKQSFVQSPTAGYKVSNHS